MSEPRRSRQEDERGNLDGEPPNKQIKLDPDVHQSFEFDAPASKVKIEDLPDLALMTILSFLSVTELTEVTPHVCSQWRRVSQDPIVWINKEYDVKYSSETVVTTLSRVPQLRSIVMDYPVNDAVLHAICDNCSHLNSLEVACSQRISYSLLDKLVMNCKNIQALTLPDQLLMDPRKARILSQLEQLKSLKVMKTCIADNSLSVHLGPFGDGCPEMSRLEVSGKNRLCTEDLDHFIKGTNKTLKHLKLPWRGKNESCVVPLLKDCTALLSLGLYDESNDIGELLEACTSLSHLANLRSLSLYFGRSETIADAFALKPFSFLHLQALRIQALCLQNSILEPIFEGCPNLRELDLSCCEGFDDGDLKELYRLKNLNSLTLSYSDGLSGTTLFHVAQVQKLQKLFLEGLDFMKLRQGVNYILDIQTLETLSFEYIKCVCYFHFDRIPEMLNNLRLLRVYDCELDPRIPGQLIQKMPALKVYTSGFEDFPGFDD